MILHELLLSWNLQIKDLFKQRKFFKMTCLLSTSRFMFYSLDKLKPRIKTKTNFLTFRLFIHFEQRGQENFFTKMMFVSKVTLHSCSQHSKIQKEGMAEYIQKGLFNFSPDCIWMGISYFPMRQTAETFSKCWRKDFMKPHKISALLVNHSMQNET